MPALASVAAHPKTGTGGDSRPDFPGSTAFRFFPMKTHFRQCTAFTLVELLTVIAIIGTLAAILIPTVGMVRQKARHAKCTTHMRGFLNAVPLYAIENGGRLPVSTYRDPDNPDNATNVVEVRVILAPYMFSIPPDVASWKVFNMTKDKMCAVDSWIYGFNSYVSKLPLSQISEPSRLAYIIDEKSRWINATTLSSSTGEADLRKAVPKPHNKKINVGFLDGHVEAWLVSQMTWAQFTRSTPSYTNGHETQHFATAEYDR